jgi:hypothetical protein
MIRLTFTKDRLFDLTLDRAPEHRSKARAAGGYRFGSAAKPSIRHYVRRLASRARALFGVMMQLIAAAKLRRIERELRIRGPHHDWLRIDDDHFTPIEH